MKEVFWIWWTATLLPAFLILFFGIWHLAKWGRQLLGTVGFLLAFCVVLSFWVQLWVILVDSFPKALGMHDPDRGAASTGWIIGMMVCLAIAWSRRKRSEGTGALLRGELIVIERIDARTSKVAVEILGMPVRIDRNGRKRYISRDFGSELAKCLPTIEQMGRAAGRKAATRCNVAGKEFEVRVSLLRDDAHDDDIYDTVIDALRSEDVIP